MLGAFADAAAKAGHLSHTHSIKKLLKRQLSICTFLILTSFLSLFTKKRLFLLCSLLSKFTFFSYSQARFEKFSFSNSILILRRKLIQD